MPAPCFFVGNIDFDNTECFDVFAFPSWTYTWKIKKANTGELVAIYDGIAFQHTFAKFGGYEFCLEVDKDDDPTNAPDIVDCVTYTTCEVCTSDSIKIEYITCPFGEGCEISLSANIHAANDIGLEPSAKIFVTYLPTPQELLGGVESYDIEFKDIDIEYNPATREAEIDPINDGGEISLVASPNPANDRLHFEFPPSDSDFRQLLFFNNIGQQMMMLDIPSGDRAADLMVGSLNPGLYFATLMEDGGLVQSTQVVIRR
ncbi:MAG: T9SS type A sorting domain-containing protein [Saprospiraceae bacterium]|nr:T9SS type A sorting domain-containing protein [Saprospiraceae bacterium]